MAKVINNSKAKLKALEKENEVLAPVPLSQPTPLVTAIAEQGNFVPPSTTPNPTGILATIPDGYPVIQSQLRSTGGKAVQRTETNGLFNLVSKFIKYWSQGGQTTFDTTFGFAPGQGYTTGAVLFNPSDNTWYVKLNNTVDTTAFPNVNWKQITRIPNLIQRIIFTDKNTPTPLPYPTLNAPDGAIGVFFTATAFGGDGGAGGSNDDNSVGGGGGGAGAGVNNLYYPLSASLRQFTVIYTTSSSPTLLFLTPDGYINLKNGSDGTSGSAGGAGGRNGLGSGGQINIPYQTLGTGQAGGTNGGNGGVSSLSNGQEVRAIGAISNPSQPFPSGNGRLGDGGGGGAGTGTVAAGGTGGNAIVIAEWVFPS